MAVTAPQPVLKMRNRNGTLASGTVLTAQVLYQHTLAARNASGKWSVPTNSGTQTNVALVISGADMAQAGSYTGDGTVVAQLEYDVEVLMFLKTGITAGHNGDAVYAIDNFTVGRSSTNGCQAGTLEEFVSANLGWVAIRRAAMAVG